METDPHGPQNPDSATSPVTPIAVVEGEPLTALPKDLYIPPDALEVFLDAFEGPLDLLLYLIKKQNLDILNIPIAQITAQYMGYIAMMESLRLELAAEYLVMAAMLAEIKSRMLLPRVESEDEDDTDPRAELIRRLQEYERFKLAAEDIDALPRTGRDVFPTAVEPPVLKQERPQPEVSLQDLLLAFKDVVVRTEMHRHHNIDREALSVRERMTNILDVIHIGDFCEFATLFNPEEGRLGVVVTFLAMLELSKESLIDIVQSEPFAPIYLKTRSQVHEAQDSPDSVDQSVEEDHTHGD
jgi:segregation and condensation protein A